MSIGERTEVRRKALVVAPVPPSPVIWMRIQRLGEDELTGMFEGLLRGMDQKRPLAEQARLLARSLPLNLAAMKSARLPRTTALQAFAADTQTHAAWHGGPGR